MRGLNLVLATLMLCGATHAANWPAWRGPNSDGHSPEKNFPTTWSTTENVAWKIALPGPGNSTPIIWGDRIYLSQAWENGAKRALLCLDRKDGKELWRKVVEFTGQEPTHDTNPYSSSTPVTDGENVYIWQGSAGLFAYTLDGKDVWQRTDLGTFTHIWGNATSPVLYKDLLIQYCGPGLRCSLNAFDKKTGKDVWRLEALEGQAKTPDQFYGCWSTPTIGEFNGRKELLIGWPKQLTAYEPETGKVLWRCQGLGPLVYTNPLIAGNTVVQMSGYHGPMLGVTGGGEGDVTESKRLWHFKEKQPQRVGSGIVHGEHVYILTDPGILQCIEARTGTVVWQEETKAKSWSSVAAAGDTLYACAMTGETLVFKAATKYELIARNQLGEMIRASPALSDGQIFIRGYKHLWCIGAKK